MYGAQRGAMVVAGTSLETTVLATWLLAKRRPIITVLVSKTAVQSDPEPPRRLS